jgi:hypothetical protein
MQGEAVQVKFHGKAYRYPTGEGERAIGVCEVLGGMYAVCYMRPNGSLVRIKIRQLPTLPRADRLQQLLDQWAALCKLPQVKPEAAL